MQMMLRSGLHALLSCSVMDVNQPFIDVFTLINIYSP